MNRFLPSKKLTVFLGVILVILLCFFVLSRSKDKKKSYLTGTNVENEVVVNEVTQQTLKNDTDGDGLKDWEETLWKTNPNDPDTDGDGTSDNSEIISNRNPLIPGPNDNLNRNIAFKGEPTKSEYTEPLTQTDILSQELFMGYVALKQNNQLGTDQEDLFINNLVSKNISKKTNLDKKYNLSELNIILDVDNGVLQKYGSKLKTILTKNTNIEYDLILIKNMLEDKNKINLIKLDSNIEIYKETQEQLSLLDVPSPVGTYHLKMINILGYLINDISKMELILEDPIMGLSGVKEYSSDEKSLQDEFQKIKQYLAAEKIYIQI